MSGERRANLEKKSECPALPPPPQVVARVGTRSLYLYPPCIYINFQFSYSLFAIGTYGTHNSNSTSQFFGFLLNWWLGYDFIPTTQSTSSTPALYIQSITYFTIVCVFVRQ